MKSIILHIDDALFFKMKKNKAEVEENLRITITWEQYIKHLFGFTRGVKEK